MEARDLDHALKAEVVDEAVGVGEEVVVIEEVVERVRVNQQRRLDCSIAARGQAVNSAARSPSSASGSFAAS